MTAHFKSHRPSTLKEALELLANQPLTIVAGGTDLMVRKRQWQGATRRFSSDVLFVKQLEALNHIVKHPGYWAIGAGVTQQQVVDHPHLPAYLKCAVSQMGTPAIRNAATIGGNVVNAAHVADTLPPLIASDATVVLQSAKETREMPVATFVTGKYETQLKPNELLIEIRVPHLDISHFSYQKLGNRSASILSKLSVLVLWERLSDRPQAHLSKVRIAIGAVDDLVIRAPHLEAAVDAKQALPQILEGYRALMHSKDDKRSTKLYKETVAINLLNQFLEGFYE